MADAIHTVVSRPGPAESRLLERLAPLVNVRRRVAAGVLLRSLESEPTRGRTTVVLLHGRGHAATVWSRWLEVLAPERRVVALDLPGFGHSGAPPEPVRSAELGLAFFAAPVEAALEAEGPVVIVGHSLGGLVALSVALGHRADVRGLVLVAAMGLSPVVSPAARLYLRAGPERIARVAALLGREAPGPSSGMTDVEIAQLRRELSLVRGGRPEAKRAFDAMVPLFGEPFHLRARLGEIAVPTLLLWGERDDAFPLPVAIDARTRLRGAELEVLPAGHSPHLELPTACLDRVRPFLSAIDEGARSAGRDAP